VQSSIVADENFFESALVINTDGAKEPEMVACASTEVQIENLRNHSDETVVSLRSLLAGGATLIPDPKRRGFYELASGSLVYYIHVSPVNGNILLLAVWPNPAGQADANQAA